MTRHRSTDAPAQGLPSAPDTIEAPPVPASRLVKPEVQDVAISRIARPNNHRLPELINKAALQELAESIEADGQLEPVRVYAKTEHESRATPGQDLVLGFGYRRLAAAELLGMTTVRAEIYPPASEQEMARARAIENLHRQNLNVMEEALAVAQLVESVTDSVGEAVYARVAAMLGKSASWVRDRAYMSRLTEDVRKLACAGLLLPGHLRELAKVGDPSQQLQIALRALNGSGWYGASTMTQRQRDKQVKDVVESQSESCGHAHRMTIESLRGLVEESKRSLRMVPWDLDVKFAGCPACVGCPHNTATDQTLFGIAPDDKGNGFCMSGACFDQKQAESEKAKQKVVKDLTRRKLAPTAEAVDQVKPTWLKRGPAQRVAKAELEPPSEAGKRGKKKNGKAEEKEEPKPKETPRSKWGRAVYDWRQAAAKAIETFICDSPAHVPGLVLLDYGLDWRHEWRYHPEHTVWNGGRNTKKPVDLTDKELGKLTPAAAGLIELAAKPATDPHLVLLGKQLLDEKDFDGGSALDLAPLAIASLARALGVENPPMPELKDFHPEGKGKPGSSPGKGEGVCRVCGCTDDDCRQCIEKTGEPCHWVEPDLCSACAGAAAAGKKKKPKRAASTGKKGATKK